MADDQAREDDSSTLVASPDKPNGTTPAINQVYTVDDAINKMGFGPFQVLVTLFCGLLWVADAMELMILSVLSPAVRCQWDLSKLEEALITSIVFFGFFLGGFFWGVIFDIVGRKRGLLLVDLIILVFGVLSALRISPGDDRIPGYPWLLLCRFGVGFGAAGTSQAVTYYAEFLPIKGRGVCIVLIDIWWALGTMFGAALAIGVMREGGLGWHWYLGLAAIPLALVLFLFPFVPESARFYLVKGKTEEAQKVIKRVALFNFKEVPPGKVVSCEEKPQRDARDVVVYSQGTVTIPDQHSDITSYNVTAENAENELIDSEGDDSPLLKSQPETITETNVTVPSKMAKIKASLSLILVNGMWKTTVILLLLWMGAAWLYYGIVLLTTTLLQDDPHCGKMGNDTSSCQLNTDDYVKILWTTVAEFPGILFTVVVIEILGRKLTIAVEFIAAMIGFLLLFICASDILLTFFLFIVRAFATGVFQAIYVYTPEVYPTSARALGLGLCTSSARIGAMITPYVAQVLWHANDYATLTLYAGSCFLMAVLAMLLPIETKGRALRDTGK